MRALSLLFLSALLAGCARTRAPAPDDVDGLLHWVYRHHDDPELLAEGMANLGTWLETTGRTEAATEGYRVTPLAPEDVAALDRPDRALQDASGVAVAAVSVHPLEPHAEITTLPDQLYNNPGGYDRYDRAVVEGDPEAFVTCDSDLDTINDIDKTTVGVRIPYVLHKDFHWVHLDERRSAFVGRSHIAESSCSDNERNCLYQSYSVDIWYRHGTGDTVRMTSTWNEITSVADAFLSEDQQVAVAVDGMLDIFENTDLYLDWYLEQ